MTYTLFTRANPRDCRIGKEEDWLLATIPRLSAGSDATIAAEVGTHSRMRVYYNLTSTNTLDISTYT